MKRLRKLILSAPNRSEQEYVLENAHIVLGRGAASDIELSDEKASRSHARIECGEAGCTVVDLGSANGTYVNGERIERVLLAPGDILTLGDTTFRFEVVTAQDEADTVAIESEADLDVTLAQATVPMVLLNTEMPRLAIHAPGKTWEIPLVQERLTIGRHVGSDLCIEHPKVSRRHAQIERVGDGYRIRDLGSTNGTWLGSRRIGEQTLTGGETIQIGDTRLVFKRGFDADDLTLVEERLPAAGLENPRTPVVFVPGMMGSELWRGSERIWPNVKLMFTQPEIFAYRPGDGIEARGIVGDIVLVPNLIRQHHYGRLGDYLEAALGYERGHDFLEFAYDWRQDLRLSARQLATTVDAWTDRRPITLIAHSLGCMVSRYFVECLDGKRKVGRLILLGGPHAGYPKAMTHLLSGAEILPFGFLGDRVRQVIATLPALYQILPNTEYVFNQIGKPLDIWSDESWLAEERRPFLRDARAFRRELGIQTSVPTVSVFGYGLKTITGVRLQRNREGGWQNVNFDLRDVGDTDVPDSSAVLPGSEIHPVQQHHGSLYVDNDVKMRLKLELTRAT